MIEMIGEEGIGGILGEGMIEEEGTGTEEGGVLIEETGREADQGVEDGDEGALLTEACQGERTGLNQDPDPSWCLSVQCWYYNDAHVSKLVILRVHFVHLFH